MSMIELLFIIGLAGIFFAGRPWRLPAGPFLPGCSVGAERSRGGDQDRAAVEQSAGGTRAGSGASVMFPCHRLGNWRLIECTGTGTNFRLWFRVACWPAGRRWTLVDVPRISQGICTFVNKPLGLCDLLIRSSKLGSALSDNLLSLFELS